LAADVVRRPHTVVVWSVGVAACAAAALSALLIIATDEGRGPGVHAALVAWITFSYVVSGLFAWRHVPDSRVGPLMVAAGFAPLLSTLSVTGANLPSTLGEALVLLPVVLFFHVFLAYPSGRLERRFERLVVAGAYVAAIGAGLVWIVLGGAGTGNLLGLVMFAVIGLAPLVFLSGLLRARLARSAVGDLFVELRTDPAPGELRDALARALRDPSLRLAYWLPEFGTYADHDGVAVQLPSRERRGVTLIDRNGVRVAALLHDPALRDEPALLDAVTAAAGIALENERLHVELRARLEDLRESRARVIEAERKERQRLERNLHDGVQQRLVALSLDLDRLENELESYPEAAGRLAGARREIAASLDELRELARGIHPAVVTGHGLGVALEELATHAPVPVRLDVNVEGRLPEHLEIAAYYLVSESLANIGKHAQATSATIEVSREDGRVLVEVIDDGVGGADTECGSGLRGLADRVEALGGRLRVWSSRGGGTRVRAEMPCAS
jgi:signal transduction histidine kinase